jgi:nucleoporin POM152
VYKHTPKDGEPRTATASVSSPNGHLEVTEPGLYEIIAALDSQCPGTVIAEGATYQVEWVPRPSAQISPRNEAAYERRNRSHILRPVCEGTDDHVDLELTGA